MRRIDQKGVRMPASIRVRRQQYAVDLFLIRTSCMLIAAVVGWRRVPESAAKEMPLRCGAFVARL